MAHPSLDATHRSVTTPQIRRQVEIRCRLLAMTKEAIARRIWDRNALRREAGLPLLPIRETFNREVSQAEWRSIVEAHYDSHRRSQQVVPRRWRVQQAWQ
jgi:hypothetical protein